MRGGTDVDRWAGRAARAEPLAEQPAVGLGEQRLGHLVALAVHELRHLAGARAVTEFVNCQGYQIAQSLFAQADGGLFGQGFGQALLERPAARRSCPPRTRTSSTR